MEFHLAYFVLRHSERVCSDIRTYSTQASHRSVRRSSQLPSSVADPRVSEYFHESQISFLISGYDEWFWTAYCFVDTFFASESTVQTYHEGGVDAASGGERFVEYPIWNPREYFLLVLSMRFRQVTKEWFILVNTLDSRLDVYVCHLYGIWEFVANIARTMEISSLNKRRSL